MSERNPTTQALLSAMMHSAQPMVLTDPALPDHPLIAVNEAFEALSGYTAAQTVGRNCRFLQGPATHPGTPSRIRQCIADQRGCVEWIVNYRRDGTMFWNLLFLSPVFAPDGRLLHYFGNQRDITLGPPACLPDYTLGRADMTLGGEADFYALLRELLDETLPPRTAAGRLEQLVEAARQLDQATTRLAPAAWRPPAG